MKYLILILIILSILFVSCVSYPGEHVADNETGYWIYQDIKSYFVKSYTIDEHNCVNFIEFGKKRVLCGTYRINESPPVGSK